MSYQNYSHRIMPKRADVCGTYGFVSRCDRCRTSVRCRVEGIGLPPPNPLWFRYVRYLQFHTSLISSAYFRVPQRVSVLYLSHLSPLHPGLNLISRIQVSHKHHRLWEMSQVQHIVESHILVPRVEGAAETFLRDVRALHLPPPNRFRFSQSGSHISLSLLEGTYSPLQG